MQYERLLSRENKIGVPPDHFFATLHEKVREENMRHFSETYGNRPIGVHKQELPKFSDNLKEYWNAKTPDASCQASSKKLYIVNNYKLPEINSESYNYKEKTEKSRKNKFEKELDKELIIKTSQNESGSTSPSKDYMRNSRWTNYHHNFIQKTPCEIEKSVSKHLNNERKQKVKDFKTAKSLIVQRMLRRGNFSPVRDQFRSTGFS